VAYQTLTVTEAASSIVATTFMTWLREGSYEECAYLLIYKKLPNQSELAEFKSVLAAEREVPQYIYDILAAMPKDTHPMDLVRTAYSALAPSDPDYAKPSTDHDANVRKAVRIIAKASTIVGNGHRIRNGQIPLNRIQITVSQRTSLPCSAAKIHFRKQSKSWMHLFASMPSTDSMLQRLRIVLPLQH
jgi:citrate synthase